MKIKLTNEAHVSYARTDDACEAFKKAVVNGQARLALEMMVDIVDYISSLGDSEVKDETVSESQTITASEAVKEVEQKQATKTTARKQAAAKSNQQKDEQSGQEEE